MKMRLAVASILLAVSAAAGGWIARDLLEPRKITIADAISDQWMAQVGLLTTTQNQRRPAEEAILLLEHGLPATTIAVGLHFENLSEDRVERLIPFLSRASTALADSSYSEGSAVSEGGKASALHALECIEASRRDVADSVLECVQLGKTDGPTGSVLR